jgi:hypothetical protein
MNHTLFAHALDDQRARVRQLEALSLVASKQQPCGSTVTSGGSNCMSNG